MIKYNNRYYITIKELAEYRQVSVQYIYKLMLDKIDKYSTTIKNKKMIDISVFNDYFEVEIPIDLLNEINQLNKQNLSTKQKKSTNIQPPKQESKTTKIPDFKTKNYDNTIIDILNKQVENFEKQVEYLKEQIAEKDKQIDTLHKLLQTSEELQRNNQILLLQNNTKSNTRDSDSLNAYSDDIDNANIENQTGTKEKKGFFSRFFR